VGGCKAADLALQKILIAKSKEVKTGCNLAETSKEGCGSKLADLPMTMMMMMMNRVGRSLQVFLNGLSVSL
jgi:hypothetical protein